MAAQTTPGFSFAEYLELEARAAFKSEFHAGQITAMAGGSERHSRLATQAVAILHQRRGKCRVYNSDLKLYIQEYDECVYPDALMICDDPVFWLDRTDVVLNPTLVVEVLSPSTERYDQEIKSHYYRSIPSLQHILLLAQDRVKVEHFARNTERTWMITQYFIREESIALLDSRFTVGDFYQDIL